MRILFLGDLMGRSGRTAAIDALPGLRRDLTLDFVVVNAENAASGFGLTRDIAAAVFDAGADAITLGNHAFDHKDILTYIDRDSRIIRPINMKAGTPGRGQNLFDLPDGRRVLVINAIGRVMMSPDYDDPFSAVDSALNACPLGQVCDAAIIDFHAEATSEKMAMGHWCDGRASLVVGTHTHIPTADHQILASGTAYQTDAGMCGDYDSVIGMDKEEPLYRFITGMRKGRFEPKIGDATVCGLFIETDDATGLARICAPLRLGGRLSPIVPE